MRRVRLVRRGRGGSVAGGSQAIADEWDPGDECIKRIGSEKERRERRGERNRNPLLLLVIVR